MAGLSLAWLLANPDVTAVVVGPGRPDQLDAVRGGARAPARRRRARACVGAVRVRDALAVIRDARIRVSVLVLSEAEVGEHLAMGECIEAMERALGELARGESYMPLRLAMRGPGASGLLGLMPAYRGGATPVYSLKAVGVFPENPRIGLDAHQGTVTLFDGENGRPTAILNASAVTAIRTAAVTALATRLLAREDAGVLAMLGSGVQAQAHLRALALVRAFARGAGLLAERGARGRAGGGGGERRARRGRAGGGRARARARRSRARMWSSPRPTRARRCWSAGGSRTGAHVNAIGASVPSRARARRRRRSPRPSCSCDSRESAAQRGRRIPPGARGGRDRRGPHPRRARRGRDRCAPGPQRPRRRSPCFARSGWRSRISRRPSSRWRARGARAPARRSSCERGSS